MEALREKRFFGLAFRAARPLVPARSRSGDGGYCDVENGL